MTTPRPSTLLLLAVAALVAAAAAWFHAWGLLALVVVGSGGIAWYRLQVARSAASQKFFGELGEDTRMTGFQPGASELPGERRPPPPPGH